MTNVQMVGIICRDRYFPPFMLDLGVLLGRSGRKFIQSTAKNDVYIHILVGKEWSIQKGPRIQQGRPVLLCPQVSSH